MKALKIIGFGSAALLALILIAALVVSTEFNYQKSITIDAPIEKVWGNISSLSAMDKWSPWNDHDPKMKKEMSGIDGTVGSKQSWESDVKEVGNGSQTITGLTPPTRLTTDLKFYGEYESEAKAFVQLTAQGNQTVATWGFESEMPYPFNLVKVFVSAESMLGKDFGNGLNKLKKLSE
jgi:hypothetical protein